MKRQVTTSMVRRRTCGALICVALTTGVASAQVTTGTISGTVKDETGAVLPGVSMTVTNIETGVVRSAVTDHRGAYHAPTLSLGEYKVQAELAGFRTGVRTGIHLTIGREATVDFTLGLGALGESLVITGGTRAGGAGRITSTITTARQIQLGIKFLF